MMKSPKDDNINSICVIIPVYNAAAYIRQAIDSALSQDIETYIYIIDDGSTDDLRDVLAAYEDNDHVRLIVNSSRLGVAKSRNKGVELANTDYIAFLDADDYWEDGKLRAQTDEMIRTGAVLSSTARQLINPDGTPTSRIMTIPEKIEYKDILKHNCISCSAVVAKREALLRFPMEHDDSHEDYITWIKIIKEYGFAVGINRPYLKYRLSEGGKSRNKIKSAHMTYKVYRYAGFGVFRSIIYFIRYAYNGVKKYYG